MPHELSRPRRRREGQCDFGTNERKGVMRGRAREEGERKAPPDARGAKGGASLGARLVDGGQAGSSGATEERIRTGRVG